MTSINNQEKKGNGLLSGGKFTGSNAPGNVASPASSNPEHLPTGYMPSSAQAAPVQPANGTPVQGNQGNGQGAMNMQPPNKGMQGGQNYTAPPQQRPPLGNPPFNNGGAVQQAGPRGPMPPGPAGGPGFRPQGPQGPGPQGPQGPQGRGGQPARPVPSGPTGRIELFRGPNFFVRTTIHPNKRPSANPLRKPTGHTTMMPKIIPDQERRVAASETRMMPALDIPNEQVRPKLYIPPWLEAAVVSLGVIISLIAHAYNMFNYPRYEMDEGTYMAAAWAVTQGKIYQYAYGYGHPPFAWMQLAGLVQLAGGFFLFGNSINTGRVLMLFYTLGSTLLVYLITRKVSGSRMAALLGMIVFAFSPLAIDFQRLVLLDNIATFWFLLSLYLLVVSKSRLPFLIASAICFAFAFLSKEVLALFLPGMIYGIWIHATKFQRKFSLVAFTYGFIAISSLWVLLALLKGELFPPGWLPWDHNDHLSFIGSFITQAGRGQKEGGITQGIYVWSHTDVLLVAMSVVSLIFNFAVGWWRRKQLLFAILGASFWLLLIRGGVVFPFYFIPLIPMTAINTALMCNTLAEWIGNFVRFDLLRAFLIVCAVGGFVFFDATHNADNFDGTITKSQTEAMAWIRANVPHNSYVVMNSYLYMELKAQGGASVGSGSTYPNADVYINIATDPKLYNLAGNNWDKVDYIIGDQQVIQYLLSLKGSKTGNVYLYQAYMHSYQCAKFTSGVGTNGLEIDIYCVQHATPRPVALAPGGGGNGLPLLASEALPPGTHRNQLAA